MITTLTRVTHSCVLLDFGGQQILTDPWFSDKPGYHWGEPYAASWPRRRGLIVVNDHAESQIGAR